MVLSCGSAAKEVRVVVYATDYLRILEGGNFMHFVALVKADNDVCLVDTFTFRLRVSVQPPVM